MDFALSDLSRSPNANRYYITFPEQEINVYIGNVKVKFYFG